MTSALARKDFRAAQDSTPSYNPVTEKMRALIVDDDRTLREGCASVLRAEGINVEVTGRGEEAIQMIHRSRFDIMLVDVYLEPVSGIDVLKAVMATSPSTLVVLMTGNPSVIRASKRCESAPGIISQSPIREPSSSCSSAAPLTHSPQGGSGKHQRVMRWRLERAEISFSERRLPSRRQPSSRGEPRRQMRLS